MHLQKTLLGLSVKYVHTIYRKSCIFYSLLTCPCQGLRNVTFLVNLSTYLIEDPLKCVTHLAFFKRKSDRKKSFFTFIIGAYCSLKSLNFNKAQLIFAKVTKKSRSLVTTKAEFIGGNVNQA